MLSTNNIHFKYKKQYLFDGLSFDLNPGSVVGLLGKNGSGKTTLLKIIAGLLFPDKGKVTLEDSLSIEASLFAASRSAKFLENVYFLPEKFTLPKVKVASLKRHYGRFYPRFDEEQFDRYLDYLELPQNALMTTLSFGQGKKAFIAFAIATRCPLIMLDEPTNGLDIPSKPRFKKLIFETRQNQNSSIIISSHQATDLQDIISSVMLLDEGQIIFNQEVTKILDKLYFSLSTEKAMPSGDLILALEEVMGYSALYHNSKNIKSKLNLEILFQALLEKGETIGDFFEPIKNDLKNSK